MGSVLYLVLIALIGLGVATAVRDAASAIGIVLGLLYLFPVVTRVVNDPEWQRHLQQISPMTAGLAIQATVRLHELPIGPWAGLGVLATWAGPRCWLAACCCTGATRSRIEPSASTEASGPSPARRLTRSPIQPTGSDAGRAGLQDAAPDPPSAADRAASASGTVRGPGTMDAVAARARCEFMSSSNRP
ncbi:hypothetical protein ACWGDS_03235 [Streptomyces sp. NPDC055059]|uniref:hypothetical protein n=1 Tax=Streptomyces sp. NPDC127172 TaxID=3345382 RepID=UPI003633850C